MVLDSKVMEWASRQGLDTAALKKAKVPIYGKWYFPDLPANEPLVNLSTGETERFPAGYRAGAVLYVKEADLKRAGIGPYKGAAAPAPAPAPAPAATAAAPVAAAVAAAQARPAPAPAPAPAAHAPAPAHHAPAPAHQAPAHGGGHGAAHSTDHAHPGPKTYIMIALILSVVTAIEVWVYYIPALLPYIFPILIVLSLFKFVLVVGWFMHLKFDHVSFTWYFAGGLGLALSLSMALIVLQIATHGPAPGDGNAHTIPANLQPGNAPAKPATGGGGH